MSDASEAASPRRRARLVAFVLLLTAVVFAPGLTAGFVYDDWQLIVRNEHIRDPANLPEVISSPFWDVSARADRGRAAYSGLWRPWISLAYMTQFQLFGESALGYHLVSLLLHLATVGLVFSFLRRRLPDVRGAPTACALGAALFAIHPSRPETVIWISGSTDLWMGMWLLLGMLALAQPRRRVRVFGGICFALAVWSKEAALLVPLLLMADAWLVERRRPRLDPEGIALAGVLVALGARLLVSPETQGELVVGGAQAVERTLSSVGHFVARIVWPYPPSLQPAPRSMGGGQEMFEPWSVAVGAAVLLGFVVLGVLATRRQSVRPWVADALWLGVPLAPVTNFIDLGAPSLVADRFLYLPLLGACALLARGVVALEGRGGRASLAATGVATAIVLAAAPLTAIRATHFESDEVLWAVELEHSPWSAQARRNVAVVVDERGDRDEALRLLMEGAQIARDRGASYEAARLVLDAARLVLRKTSDADQDTLRRLRRFYDELAETGRMSLELEGFSITAQLPEADRRTLGRDTEAFVVPRAISHARTGQLAKAERQLRDLLESSPRYPDAWNLLIAVHARQGEWDEARHAAQAAARHLPGSRPVEAMTRNLERARAMSRQPVQTDVERAIRDARVQVTLGAPQAARRILDDARAEHPDDVRLVLERAKADVADGRFDLARAVLEAAKHRDPARAAQWDLALERLAEARRQSEAGRGAQGGEP